MNTIILFIIFIVLILIIVVLGVYTKKHQTVTGNGQKKPIIHISGPAGSGTKTLGTKLKNKYGNKIDVFNTFGMFDEFVKSYYNKPEDKDLVYMDKKAQIACQKYVDDIILNTTKPLILVGLPFVNYKNQFYYNLHASKKFYIDIDKDLVLTQKCFRLLRELEGGYSTYDLLNDNKNYIDYAVKNITHECDYNSNEKWIKKWYNDHKSRGYTMLPRDAIYSEVCKLL
jgi:hypothetical protein